MSCGCDKDKGKHGETYVRECDVCCLVDKDCSHKLVKYCKICKAYICSECLGKYGRRFMAMIQKAREELKAMSKK